MLDHANGSKAALRSVEMMKPAVSLVERSRDGTRRTGRAQMDGSVEVLGKKVAFSITATFAPPP